MKTVIIHGQSHKGSTYHIAHELAEKIGGELTEYFLPKDFGEFCIGCTNCFTVHESKCPHYQKLTPITESIDAVDWNGVSDQKKKAIGKAASSIAKKIVRRAGKVKPDIKTKAFFFIMHLLQRNGFNERDVKYWKEKGRTENKRPWK